MSLGLVHRGYTPAVLFDAAGRPVLAAEAVRKKCLLVERGRFAPVTRLNLEMLDRVELIAAAGKLALVSALGAFHDLAAHLLEHLRANGLVRGLECDPAALRTSSSDEVRDRLCSGDPSWQELVTPEVAAAISARGAFGSRCDLPAR